MISSRFLRRVGSLIRPGYFLMLAVAALWWLVLSDVQVKKPTGFSKGDESDGDRHPFSTVTKAKQFSVLWNCPLHSWTGVANEALHFLIPLARHISLSVVGGEADDFLKELPRADSQLLTSLHAKRSGLKRHYDFYITQYAPGTYSSDAEQYKDVTAAYRIGRAMFETTWLPNGWSEACNKYMDEVWVPSHFGAEVFRKAGVKTKITVIPESIDTRFFSSANTPHNRSLLTGVGKRFAFLSVAKWEDRKGLDVLLEAFHKEFSPDESVALYLRSAPKLSREDIEALQKASPPVHFVPRIPYNLSPQLYKAADAFVLATHGEGWGRPLMEAMAMGLPAIATNWSGQTEFMTNENSILVQVDRLEAAFPREPEIRKGSTAKHRWAHVNVTRLRKALRWVYAHRDEARRIGKQSSADIHRFYGRERVAQLIVHRLVAIQNQVSSMV